MQLNEALQLENHPYRLSKEQIEELAEIVLQEFQEQNRAAVAGVLTIDGSFSSSYSHLQMAHGSLKGDLEKLVTTRRDYFLEKLKECGVCLALTRPIPEKALKKPTKKAA